MAKRHRSLIPLSRDHHDGLLLALRLKQGEKALERLWSHDPQWQASYVVRFYKEHLTPHFEAEEKILFPVLRKYDQASFGTIGTLLRQHEEIRKRVKEFEKPDDRTLRSGLKDFGELLEQHIRIEENELFPSFEKSVPKEVADEAGREIEKIDKGPTE